MGTKESLKKNPFIITFKPEGLVSSSDLGFLEQIEERLQKIGVDPQQVVYSGTDGSPIIKDVPFPRPPAAFVMNGAGWREAIKTGGEPNPAEYTEQPGKSHPCLAVYDKNQLQETYGGEISQHQELSEIHDGVVVQDQDLSKQTLLKNWEPGDFLRDLSPSRPVQETVTHVNYPDASPTDALLGFIFIEQE